MTLKPIGIDDDGQLPTRARNALAGNLSNPVTPEGAALRDKFVGRPDLEESEVLARKPAAKRRGYGPAFEDCGVVLIDRTTSGLVSLYGPSLIDMSVDPTWTGPRFILKYSTDHDITGNDGIGAATSADVLGPYTPVKPSGNPVIYRDTIVGNETETPSDLYVPGDPDGKPWYMFYQQQGVGRGNQSTLLAKAANPLVPSSYTRVGIAIQAITGGAVASTGGPGDGQTTYAAVMPIGSSYLAITIDGGGSYAGGKVLWFSDDGVKWTKLPHRLAERTDLTNDTELRYVYSSIFEWRGDMWAVLSKQPWGSGLWSSTDARPYVAKLSSDLRSIVTKPAPMFAGDVLPAGVTEVGSYGIPLEVDGYLYVPYRANGWHGQFRMLRAEV